MRKALRLLALLFLVIIPAAGVLAACNEVSAATASCGFVVNDGIDGRDTKYTQTIYPGQTVSGIVNKKVTYVPCNSRNYIINDGKTKDANGSVVGDRGTLILATTKNGVPITIAARAFWTLNQSDKAMRDFYAVCFKYHCASDKDESGTANFSTPGWNGLLAENFGPSIDAVARLAAIESEDSIWQDHNPVEYKKLQDKMSAAFADVIRATLGYPEDLFCGSGNSDWPDHDNPGVGTFTCSPVRFQVDDVQRGEIKSDAGSKGATTINAQRLANAQALYGPNAGDWLGLQDSIAACRSAAPTGAPVTCVFNIGGNIVSFPVTNQSPAPTPEPSSAPSAKPTASPSASPSR